MLPGGLERMNRGGAPTSAAYGRREGEGKLLTMSHLVTLNYHLSTMSHPSTLDPPLSALDY